MSRVCSRSSSSTTAYRSPCSHTTRARPDRQIVRMGAVPKAGDEGRLTCASMLSLDPPVRLEQAEQARVVAEGRNVGHARRQPLLDRRPLCPLCSRLSKVVSHELRTYATAARGNSEGTLLRARASTRGQSSSIVLGRLRL